MELPIRWVATFVAVVEHQHFARAARSLHLSASAVSKHVRALEHELGVTLLDRQPGSGVALTAQGRQFADAAEALLRAHEAALAAVRTPTTARTVRLGVLAGVPFSRRQVDFLRATVALRSPGWSVSVHRIGFTATVSSLLDRVVDVLWTGHASGHPRLAAVRIGELERTGLIGPRHPLAGATRVSGAEFAALPMLHNPAVATEWMEPFCLTDVRPSVEGRLVAIDAEDYGSVVRHVQRGDGVAVTVGPLPPTLLRAVLTVQLAGVAPMATHAAFRRDDRREVVRTLVDALGELRLSRTTVSGGRVPVRASGAVSSGPA